MELKARIRPAPAIDDSRIDPRRQLNLQVGAWEPASSTIYVVVRNLSISGLLIETDAKLSIGDAIELELPIAGASTATVVWTRSNLFGCKFSEPISSGAISAALLQSPIDTIVGPEVDFDPDEYPKVSSEVDEDSKTLPIGVKSWIIAGLAISSWILVGCVAVVLMYIFSVLGVGR